MVPVDTTTSLTLSNRACQLLGYVVGPQARRWEFSAPVLVCTLSITKICLSYPTGASQRQNHPAFFLTPLLAASSSPRRRYGVDSAPPLLSPPMFCGAIFRTYRAKVISSIDATKLFVLLPLESNCVVDNSFVGSGTL